MNTKRLAALVLCLAILMALLPNLQLSAFANGGVVVVFTTEVTAGRQINVTWALTGGNPVLEDIYFEAFFYNYDGDAEDIWSDFPNKLNGNYTFDIPNGCIAAQFFIMGNDPVNGFYSDASEIIFAIYPISVELTTEVIAGGKIKLTWDVKGGIAPWIQKIDMFINGIYISDFKLFVGLTGDHTFVIPDPDSANVVQFKLYGLDHTTSGTEFSYFEKDTTIDLTIEDPVIEDPVIEDPVIEDPVVDGWGSGPNWRYYLNGDLVTGWLNDGGKWYFMNADGNMQTGWVKDGGNWHYLAPSGDMRTGWLKEGTIWYYLTPSGAMKTGWVKDGPNWYYLVTSGGMRTGWVKDGPNWYYMNSSGAMKTGWLQQGGHWYYLWGSGAMANGTQTIDGKVSSFDSSGAWLGYK